MSSPGHQHVKKGYDQDIRPFWYCRFCMDENKIFHVRAAGGKALTPLARAAKARAEIAKHIKEEHAEIIAMLEKA